MFDGSQFQIFSPDSNRKHTREARGVIEQRKGKRPPTQETSSSKPDPSMTLRRLTNVAPFVGSRRGFTPAASNSDRDELMAVLRRVDAKLDGMEAWAHGACDDWYRRKQNLVFAASAAGFVALGLVAAWRDGEEEARHLVEVKAVESSTASRTCVALLSAMCDGKRSANRD